MPATYHGRSRKDGHIISRYVCDREECNRWTAMRLGDPPPGFHPVWREAFECGPYTYRIAWECKRHIPAQPTLRASLPAPSEPQGALF